MNFISAFEELNKLYEEKTKVVPTLKKTTVKSGEAAIEEACTKEDLTEAADDDVIEIMDDEPIEEPSVEEEAVEDESIVCRDGLSHRQIRRSNEKTQN